MRSVRAELGCLLLAVACTPAAEPRIESAWVRSAPPGALHLAGYLSLDNPTAVELVVVGAESPAFAGVEIHETRIDDGVASMRSVERVVVPAGRRIEFAPGGLHLMLIGPHSALEAGARVPLRLRFADGAAIEFEAPVAAGPPR